MCGQVRRGCAANPGDCGVEKTESTVPQCERLLVGVRLQPIYVGKTSPLLVCLVTEVYFYLTDAWKVTATTTAPFNVILAYVSGLLDADICAKPIPLLS